MSSSPQASGEAKVCDVDRILGISPEQRRIFDTVHEFWRACWAPVADNQRETLRTMIKACILKVYGCSWVTEFERTVATETALCVLAEFDKDKSAAADAYFEGLDAITPRTPQGGNNG